MNDIVDIDRYDEMVKMRMMKMEHIPGIVVEHRPSFKVKYENGKREDNSVSFRVPGSTRITFNYKKTSFHYTTQIGEEYVAIETDYDPNTDKYFIRLRAGNSVVTIDIKDKIRSIRVIPENIYGMINIKIAKNPI